MNINKNAPIESILTAIGENLTHRAKQAGLKKKDLADLADVNQNTITAILRGGDLRVSTLIRITRVMGDTSWLLPLLEVPEPTPLDKLKYSRQKFNKEMEMKRPQPRPIGRKSTQG